MKENNLKTKFFYVEFFIGITLLMVFLSQGYAKSDFKLKCDTPVFLFNCDSDENTGEPDYADKTINGPKDLLDLTTIFLSHMPCLTQKAKCYIHINNAARTYIQLFYKSGENYIYVENNEKQEIPIDLLRDSEVEFRIEANSPAHSLWDGKVTITARLEDNNRVFNDSVRLKVAPFMLLSAVQKALKIYVRDFPGKNEKLIKTLKELTPKLGVELKVIKNDGYDVWNIWLQDVMEVGYCQTPSQTFHVVLNANRGKSLDAMPKKEILGPDHGWFKWSEFKPETGAGRGGDSWLDWYGNLEVTPPLPGKPFGRILYGYNKHTNRSLNPNIVDMLKAQRVQTPLIKIHTGWLLIKHVDEIFNFIPVKGKIGFKILVPDVTLTFSLLKQWADEGKGEIPLFRDFKKNVSVSSLLNDSSQREFNIQLQKDEIEPNIKTIIRETGVTEEHVIRIPVLFEKKYNYAVSLMSNMVNSAYMNGHMLIADPRGPVFKGRDLMQDFVSRLLSKEGIVVHFVDDLAYHRWGGNVHCATNVTYQPYAIPWWKGDGEIK
jgi:protein-arginine deiminase